MLSLYQSPHHELQPIPNLIQVEQERQDLITSIDQFRHDSQVMAKLQMEIKGKMTQKFITNSNKAATLL